MNSSEQTDSLPYWRLSGFYFFYFAIVGLYMPYWPLYLHSIGLTAHQIGIYVGVGACTRIIAPNMWGWIADHRGRRMPVIRIALILSTLLFVCIAFTTKFHWLVLLGALFGFFWTAALPQFEATTMTHLGKRPHSYPSIRIWGSIGFILVVVLLGKYFETNSIDQLPWFVTLMILLCMLDSLFVPERGSGVTQVQVESLWEVLKKPAVIALLLGCFFMQFSHAPYYTFYSLYLETHGYSKTFIGLMWGLGVLCEVGVFLIMRKLVVWLGLKRLLVISLLLAALRWWMIAYFVDSVALLIMAQCLHAATFGLYHATAIQLIHHYFPGRLQGRGQALFSSLSYGLGAALGSFISGSLWDSFGATTIYMMAAVAVLCAACICAKWLEN